MHKGCEAPRVYTPPRRELTPDTSLGFDICEFSETVLGVELLPWQRFFLVHAFEIDGDFSTEWRFRFRTILLLVGRQNGKTTIGTVISLYFLYVLQVALILGTAQDVSTAEDTWQTVVDMAQADPELAAEIEHVWQTNGSKRLALIGHREYRVRASNRKAGRGRSADLVLLDEIREHTDFKAWAALSKTGMARDSSIILAMSNAGDADSVLLRHLRTRAHMAIGDPDGLGASQGLGTPEELADVEDDTLAVFEWSAEPGARITDPEAWAQANPSLGYYITERAIKSALATDTENDFRTEVLCQWITAAIAPPFPVGAWEAGKDEASEIAHDETIRYALDVSHDRGAASIAACGMRADGRWHVELIEHRAGIGWTVDWFTRRATERPMIVAMQGRGAPVSGFAEILDAIDGVTVYPVQGPDLTGFCGRFWDAVAALDPEGEQDPAKAVYHRTQPALDLAANIAVTKPLGDSVWAWDRAKSKEDISPLVAVTMAYGLATKQPEAPKVYASAYATDEEITIATI